MAKPHEARQLVAGFCRGVDCDCVNMRAERSGVSLDFPTRSSAEMLARTDAELGAWLRMGLVHLKQAVETVQHSVTPH